MSENTERIAILKRLRASRAGYPMQLRNPDGPEAAALIEEMAAALEPLLEGAEVVGDGTVIVRVHEHHLNRAHAILAKLKGGEHG